MSEVHDLLKSVDTKSDSDIKTLSKEEKALIAKSSKEKSPKFTLPDLLAKKTTAKKSSNNGSEEVLKKHNSLPIVTSKKIDTLLNTKVMLSSKNTSDTEPSLPLGSLKTNITVFQATVKTEPRSDLPKTIKHSAGESTQYKATKHSLNEPKQSILPASFKPTSGKPIVDQTILSKKVDSPDVLSRKTDTVDFVTNNLLTSKSKINPEDKYKSVVIEQHSDTINTLSKIPLRPHAPQVSFKKDELIAEENTTTQTKVQASPSVLNAPEIKKAQVSVSHEHLGIKKPNILTRTNKPLIISPNIEQMGPSTPALHSPKILKDAVPSQSPKLAQKPISTPSKQAVVVKHTTPLLQANQVKSKVVKAIPKEIKPALAEKTHSVTKSLVDLPKQDLQPLFNVSTEEPSTTPDATVVAAMTPSVIENTEELQENKATIAQIPTKAQGAPKKASQNVLDQKVFSPLKPAQAAFKAPESPLPELDGRLEDGVELKLSVNPQLIASKAKIGTHYAQKVVDMTHNVDAANNTKEVSELNVLDEPVIARSTVQSHLPQHFTSNTGNTSQQFTSSTAYSTSQENTADSHSKKDRNREENQTQSEQVKNIANNASNASKAPAESFKLSSLPSLSTEVLKQIEKFRESGRSWMRIPLTLADGKTASMHLNSSSHRIQVRFSGETTDFEQEINDSWASLKDNASKQGITLEDLQFQRTEQHQYA